MKYFFPYVGVRLASGCMKYLTFRQLSLLSNGVAFVLLHIIQYRKKTALGNLARCFPSSSPDELKKLLPAIYRNLSDVFFETIKAFHISPPGILRHIQRPAQDQLDLFHQHFRGAILVTAHLANWEWCGYTLTDVLGEQGIAVYRPLKNPKVDRLMKKHRERSLMKIIPMREIVKLFARGKAAGHFLLLIADQSPDPDGAHWGSFLNVPTPFFKGPATMAIRYDLPVFFVHLERTGRHAYAMHLRPVCLEPQQSNVADITESYIQTLESLVRQAPADWLWTHRRWKHRPPPSLSPE